MADDRTYIRVHDGMDEHPKVEPLTDAAFRLLLRSWFYCSRNRTDGRITDQAWKRRGTARTRGELMTAGLVEQHDGYVQMHDYLEHQRSAQEIQLLQETRGDNGAYGNHVRWHMVRRKPKKDCQFCNAEEDVPDPVANGSQVRSDRESPSDRKPIASTEAEAEDSFTSVLGGSHVSSDSPDEPPRCPQHKGMDRGRVPGCWACKGLREQWETTRSADVEFQRPPWCGDCDQWSRKVEVVIDGRDAMRNCPKCHPLAEEAS